MGGVERDVCEEGLVGLGAAANEVAGGVSGEIGAVALGLDGLGPAVKIVTVVVAVGVVVAVSRDVTEEFVEAAIGGTAAGGEADVPLAEAGGGVVGLFEILGEDFFVVR